MGELPEQNFVSDKNYMSNVIDRLLHTVPVVGLMRSHLGGPASARCAKTDKAVDEASRSFHLVRWTTYYL